MPWWASMVWVFRKPVVCGLPKGPDECGDVPGCIGGLRKLDSANNPIAVKTDSGCRGSRRAGRGNRETSNSMGMSLCSAGARHIPRPIYVRIAANYGEQRLAQDRGLQGAGELGGPAAPRRRAEKPGLRALGRVLRELRHGASGCTGVCAGQCRRGRAAGRKLVPLRAGRWPGRAAAERNEVTDELTGIEWCD